MPTSKQKLYCYVDETGQDTFGVLFIVAVVIAVEERPALLRELEEIETRSGKGKVKWMKAKDDARLKYIRAVLSTAGLKGKFYYEIHRHTREYPARTVLTTARAITHYAATEYKAVIFVDGLPRSKVHWFSSELRHLFVKTKKVRGIRKEEGDPFIRLADAICGFVRGAIEGRPELRTLLESAKQDGVIREL